MAKTPKLEPEIAAALDAIVKARDAAARPLKFSKAAAEQADKRSVGQFRANLPVIPGGFASVKKGLVDASKLFGSMAKSIAKFQNPAAKEISVEQMEIARAAAERACKLTIASKKKKSLESVSAPDGLVCA